MITQAQHSRSFCNPSKRVLSETSSSPRSIIVAARKSSSVWISSPLFTEVEGEEGEEEGGEDVLEGERRGEERKRREAVERRRRLDFGAVTIRMQKSLANVQNTDSMYTLNKRIF